MHKLFFVGLSYLTGNTTSATRGKISEKYKNNQHFIFKLLYAVWVKSVGFSAMW